MSFKAGDIVEVQCTFTLVPVKGGEWKMFPTLRCLTLLEGKHGQVRAQSGERWNMRAHPATENASGDSW